MSAPSQADRRAVVQGAVLWGAGLLALGLLYRETLWDWYRFLKGDLEEGLGMLVPPLVGYLVWRRRDALAQTPAGVSWAGALAFVVAMAFTAGTEALWFGTGARLGLWCAVATLTWAAWGGSWTRVLVVPLLFLFFAQPMPVTLSDLLTHPLRLRVTAHAAQVLSLGGLPAVAEGVLLHMPRATLETTAACSGVRGFVAAVAVALLLADLVPGPRLTTAAMFPGALLVAYVLNLVRVMMEAVWTSVAGGPSAAIVHTSFGLFTFAGVAWILAIWQLRTSDGFS